MKTILVPTDFSECAEDALRYACFIAQKTNSKIILLHVLQPEPVETNSDGEWTGSWAGEKSLVAMPAMMGFLKFTKEKMNGLMNLPPCREIIIHDFIEQGNISEQINAAAKKHSCDLIVMGTHGTSGLNEVFIGSNAEHVVRDAEVPVLSIKESPDRYKINAIVFATDFSKETDLIFPTVKMFAEIFGAKIHLVKIVPEIIDKERQHLDLMKKFAQVEKERNGIEYSTHVYAHDVKEIGIRNYAGTVDADIITLGTHGRHGLARFFKGSVAENIVNHASLPVLTINIHKKLMGKKKAAGRKKMPKEILEEDRLRETTYSGHIPSI